MRWLFASLLFVAACATPPVPPAPGHNYLAGTSWVMTGNAAAAPSTIAFETARASGFAGCNRWFASVTHDGEALRFGDVGLTRMMCAEGPMGVERDFVAALGNTRYGHYDQDVLVLLDERQQVIARFNRSN